MDNSKFNIFEAVRDAYLFVGREWPYLLKAGLLPVIVQIGLSLFIQFQREDASQIEGYLWSLPATMLFAWFTFLEMRLLLLGERLDRLPQDHACLLDRQHAMKLSVITALLFNMGVSSVITILMAAASSGQWGASLPLTLGGLFLIGALFWGVRFGVVPILVAVHYPILPALQQTRGMMFSLRLIGMGMLCLFPLAIVLQILLAVFMDRSADLASQLKLTPVEQMAIIILNAPLSLPITVLLNAAAAYALKQILGRRSDGVLA